MVKSVHQQDTPDQVFYIVKSTWTHEGIEYYSGASFHADGYVSHIWDISQKSIKEFNNEKYQKLFFIVFIIAFGI